MLLAGGAFGLLQGGGIVPGLGPAAGDQSAVQIGAPGLAPRHGRLGGSGGFHLASNALIAHQRRQMQRGPIREPRAGGGQAIQPDDTAGDTQGLPIHDRDIVGGERARGCRG